MSVEPGGSIERIREALADPALNDKSAPVADVAEAICGLIGAARAVAIRELLAERDALKAESESLREMLAHLYAGPDLYSDDGELQDARAVPFIDFKRDTAADIRCAMVERKGRT